MSLINQVLNELENRGANAPLGEAEIRAVPLRKQSHTMRYAVIAVSVLILVVLAKWYLERTEIRVPQQSVATLPVDRTAIAVSGPASAPASAVADAASMPVAATASASLHGKPLLIVKNEEPPANATDTKKNARHKQQPVAEAVEESAENASTDSTENLQINKKISPLQRAESEFRKANLAVQEGRTNDALAGYERALLIDATHKDARRAWVGLLLSLKRNDDAEIVLKKGLRHDSHETSFAMLLARLQVERGAVPLALKTLKKTLPFAEGQADYQAFMAALLQRQNLHEEAIAYYQIALKLAPSNGIWLMGMGISLQALQRNSEARDAYQRALASNSLNAQLQAFVQNKLKEL